MCRFVVFESGVDEYSYGFELSVAWVSASFRLCWNDCFVDDEPDEFTGFHDDKKTVTRFKIMHTSRILIETYCRNL